MSTDAEQLDSTTLVVTPENIAFRYQLAGPFRRTAALAIDYGVRMVVCVAALIVVLLLNALAGPAVWAFALILMFVLEWFYGGLFETFWNGQTPGKRMMGIRVLSADGQPINGLQAVLRNILRLVDMMPLLPLTVFGLPPSMIGTPTCIVGLCCMMATRRYQRLGDLVCGTMVVVEEYQRAAGLQPMNDRSAIQLAGELPANYRVSRHLSRALAAYVDRRRYFSEARRTEVARHVAEPLIRRLHLSPETDYDLLLCALYYRAFIADWVDEEQLDRDGAEPPAFLMPSKERSSFPSPSPQDELGPIHIDTGAK